MRPKKRRLRLDNGKRKDLCGIHAAALRHCECRYQQAFRQKAADAMEQARYSFAFAGLEPLMEPFDQPFRAGSPKCPTVSINPITSRPPRERHTNPYAFLCGKCATCSDHIELKVFLYQKKYLKCNSYIRIMGAGETKCQPILGKMGGTRDRKSTRLNSSHQIIS